jgi:hypothetical protein
MARLMCILTGLWRHSTGALSLRRRCPSRSRNRGTLRTRYARTALRKCDPPLARDASAGTCSKAIKPRISRPKLLQTSVDPRKQPHNLAPCLRIHRQRIDDVGPPIAVGVAVAQQRLGDLVAIVADQHVVGRETWAPR